MHADRLLKWIHHGFLQQLYCEDEFSEEDKLWCISDLKAELAHLMRLSALQTLQKVVKLAV